MTRRAYDAEGSVWRRVWPEMADDRGNVVIVVAIVSAAALLIFSGGGSAVAVKNKQDRAEAAKTMREEAGVIEQRVEGRDDAAAQQARKRAEDMKRVADSQESKADLAMKKDLGSAALDAAVEVTPMGKLKWVGKGIKALSNVKSVYDVNSKRLENQTPVLDAQTKSDLDEITGIGKKDEAPPEPVDGVIVEAKIAAGDRVVREIVPARSDALYRGLAKGLVIDTEYGGDQAKLSNAGDPYLSRLSDATKKIDPPDTSDATKGRVMINDPAAREALYSGQRNSVPAYYFGDNGAEPVMIRRDPDTGKLTTEFSLLGGTPDVPTDTNLAPDQEKLPSALTPQRKSCPYVLAFDGTAFQAVNDIISVSRDPAREYDDRMVFAAAPSRDGTFELRIAEIRDEESFLDFVRFSAVVPDAGFEAVATPGDVVLSVRDAASAVAVRGADASNLGAEDGRGFRGSDGASFEAEFLAPGPNAVLLVSSDGFEVDAGGPGAELGKRPALFVDAWSGGRWWPAGTVYPRERRDRVGVDVSAFREAGRVRVRLRAASCNTGVYQLVDRVALSTAPRDRVRVRALRPLRVQSRFSGAAALIAAVDDRRLHTRPGDTVRFVFGDPGTRTFLVESRGWYRAVP